jgi:NAD(P)-dependent dehydrogenase (short-subunit alcohol dehydrogenase family)
MSNEDRVAVVTGAASGIGRAVAVRAAADGMRVAAIDIDAAGLAGLGREVGSAGEVIEMVVDVTDSAAVDEAAARVMSTFGDVHLMSNNAGIAFVGSTWETPLDDWRRIFDVNLFGIVHMMHAFVPRLLERGSSTRIVNTASMLGLQCAPFITAYTATKHAVVALSECLAGELAMAGSTMSVAVLCPGRVATPLGAGTEEEKMIEEIDAPLNVPVTPEFVAEIVVQAARSPHGFLFTHAESTDAFRERFDAIVATASLPG